MPDAAAVLHDLKPFVERVLERHLSTAQEWFPHEYIPWEQGRSFTEQPWEAGDSRLSGIARTAMELNLLTVTRGSDPVELERARIDHVSRGYYPSGDCTAIDGLVYVTLQELATRI